MPLIRRPSEKFINFITAIFCKLWVHFLQNSSSEASKFSLFHVSIIRWIWQANCDGKTLDYFGSLLMEPDESPSRKALIKCDLEKPFFYNSSRSLISHTFHFELLPIFKKFW
jgi:hypothetical protein